jgi:ADP-heptose:LPS heptosyltransferase
VEWASAHSSCDTRVRSVRIATARPPSLSWERARRALIVYLFIRERHIAKDVRRILLVSLDNLGDLVFTSALVPPLRARYPNARITLWCKSYAADIAPLIPGVDDIFASDPFWDRAPGRSKGSLARFLRTLMRVRLGGHDVAVLASSQWRVAAATALSAIPVRIGLERRRNRRWLTHTLPPENRSRPIVQELGRLLGPLGIHEAPRTYRLDPAPLAARRDSVRARLGNTPVAALHPFAANPKRCVDHAVWIRVAAGIEARGYTPLWIGSQLELREFRQRAPREPSWLYIDEVASNAIADTAAASSLARLFIGHDSGPLHVASALGVSCVGVFTPLGEPARTSPQGTGRHRIVTPAPLDALAADQILAEADVLHSLATPDAT